MPSLCYSLKRKSLATRFDNLKRKKLHSFNIILFSHFYFLLTQIYNGIFFPLNKNLC